MNEPTPYNSDLRAFEESVKRIVNCIRETLAHHDIGSFRFDIEASGRTSSGDARLSYVLSEHGYTSTDSVRASTIRPLIEEFLRRKGFNALHAPLELPPPGIEPPDSEIF